MVVRGDALSAVAISAAAVTGLPSAVVAVDLDASGLRQSEESQTDLIGRGRNRAGGVRARPGAMVERRRLCWSLVGHSIFPINCPFSLPCSTTLKSES